MSTVITQPPCSAYCNRYFHFHTQTGTITKDLFEENKKNQSSILLFVLIPLQTNIQQGKTLHGRVALTLMCATMAVVSTLVTAVFYGVITIIFVLERSYLLVFPDQLVLIAKQIQKMEQIFQEEKKIIDSIASLETPLQELTSQIVSFQNELAAVEQQHKLSGSIILNKSQRLEERAQEAQKVFDWMVNYLRENFFVGDMKDGMRLSATKKFNFQQMAERARELEKVTENLIEVEQEIEKLDREVNEFNTLLGQRKQQLSQLYTDGALSHEAYRKELANLAQQLQLIEEEKYVQLNNPRLVMV